MPTQDSMWARYAPASRKGAKMSDPFWDRDSTLDSTTAEERNFAMLAHLGTFIGYIFLFGHIAVPVVVWLTKGRDSDFIAEHAKESANFQISVTIYAAACALLAFLLIGFLLLIPLLFLELVCVISASLAASRGELYRYPLTIRFIS